MCNPANLGATKTSGINRNEKSEDHASRSISSSANADRKQALSAVGPCGFWWVLIREQSPDPDKCCLVSAL